MLPGTGKNPEVHFFINWPQHRSSRSGARSHNCSAQMLASADEKSFLQTSANFTSHWRAISLDEARGLETVASSFFSTSYTSLLFPLRDSRKPVMQKSLCFFRTALRVCFQPGIRFAVFGLPIYPRERFA